ncbi:IclR family transcriptional regulator [bacterium]|nr:IclR family transcriptional regulator [bacterium]
MKKKTFSSLEKTIDILDLFDLESREFSALEIAQALDLPLSSVYKYIDFLVSRQLLRHKPNSKMLGLGLMILRLSYVLEKDYDLVDLARPYLESLCQETGETAFLTIIVGTEAICVERVEPQRLIKLGLDQGRQLPLHSGSSSKVLLAFQESDFIESYLAEQPLTRLTDMTITDPDRLRADLEQIRKQGYAFSDSEVDAGARAVSVPLLDQKGNAIAGLTVAGPSERIGDQQSIRFYELLKTTADEISHGLGYDIKKKTRKQDPGSEQTKNENVGGV